MSLVTHRELFNKLSDLPKEKLKKYVNLLSREVREKFYNFSREKVKRMARESLWKFCKNKNKDFYKEDRQYLKHLCDVLQKLYEGKLINPKTDKVYKKIMINMPPRFGKSSTANCFIPWVFGQDNNNRVISVSYNEILSSRFGKNARNHIQEESLKADKVPYNHIFPDTKVKKGDASGKLWSLEEQYFNYLATSPMATATGIGCNIGIVDDLIKSAKESNNSRVLEEHWEWYTDTFLSRLEAGAIQIVIMTRWATKDLCGRLLEIESDEWYVVKYEALDEKTDTMLCEEVLPREDYVSKQKKTSKPVFRANFHQEPVDLKGALYKKFKIYERHKFIHKFEKIICWCDTADKGDNYLSAIIFGMYQGQAYILDIYYTQDDMDITEPELAERLFKHKVQECYIESNNGGRGFKRSVERLLWENHNSRSCHMEDIAQRDNKESRILTNATDVQDNIYYPENWDQDYPEFARDVKSYQAKGKNKVDDGPDNLTQVAEHIEAQNVDGVSNW